MEVCPFMLQGAAVTTQGSLVSVCFGSGGAGGFALLILGIAFKLVEFYALCNGLFWFSALLCHLQSHLCRGQRVSGWDLHMSPSPAWSLQLFMSLNLLNVQIF